MSTRSADLRVVARHERDSLDTELDADQRRQLEGELGLFLWELHDAGIRRFECEDGWHYTIRSTG